MSSLRVLTYNTQMRSWGLEALAQRTFPPTTNTEERAKTISQRIKDSPRSWDIVCLQEVFDEDAREVFKSELGGEFPHIVIKADQDELALQALITGGAAWLLVVPTMPLLWGLGVITAGVALLLSTKFEDSGLMIFSRLPFQTTPIPETLEPHFDAAMRAAFPNGIPKVAFVPYEEAAFPDDLSCKGALYAGFFHDGNRPIHIVTTHTQAAPHDDPEKFKEIRKSQLQQVFNLISSQVDGFPGRAEVILCGDINIDGMQHTGGPRSEWKERFATSGSSFTDELWDMWHREQCPGDPSSGTPLPDFFDRGATIPEQRLDYFVMPAPFPGRLVAQHICIPYEVAAGSNTNPPNNYTSDHMPLSLDLFPARLHNSALTAEPVLFPTADQTVSDLLVEGEMHWYRIDEAGGYAFRMVNGSERVSFEVYTADNLSIPYPPFKTLADEAVLERRWGTRFALPSAPFFIRVFMKSRVREAAFKLAIHRFEGTSADDAIPLLRGVPIRFAHKSGAQHCDDDPSTPWSEFDCVWFTAPLDTNPDGGMTVTSTITLRSHHNRHLVQLLEERPGEPRRHVGLADQLEPGEPAVAVHTYRWPATGYFLVQRKGTPPFDPNENLPFDILLTSDVSYLYAVPGPRSHALGLATLTCIDETDGTFGNEWGSDDIQINISSDGRNILHIPHSDRLRFDDDSRRDLPELDGLRYVGEAQFELVELDDLSAADRASVTIPSFANATEIVGNPTSKMTRLHLSFEDGSYDLHVTISQEPPPAD
ncbi:endonuclease/exonuclease/phosphatase family protein [Microvirga rosea]|uniref:endonuclease/exonuclease/phosphatase family protein n=1 Tax=Microvirga rosea TaxID=2715425 RepID=UPI001D0B45DC|nr:endonuclease/exonuclease/phosphatase family protein [Microvirga rosea]MCB8823321.1 endonuclease/exonuclease/phosphatase family protein [Microvirga rosea]